MISLVNCDSKMFNKSLCTVSECVYGRFDFTLKTSQMVLMYITGTRGIGAMVV